MGRPLESKIVTTLKPRIPEELKESYCQAFDEFRKERESEGLSVNQTDFINNIIVKFLKSKGESK